MAQTEQRSGTRTILGFLVALIALHYAIVALYTFEVIPQEFNPPDRIFWFHHGGDNAHYYALAQSLIDGEVVASKYPLGFPITLIPFIAILQPQSQEQLMEPVAAFWALVMFPIGQVLLFRLAALLTGRHRLALLTVFLWTILPLVMWLGLRLVANTQVAETNSVHLIWAQMLSDGPATLLTILSFLLYAELRHAGSHRSLLMLAGTLGVAMGWLVLVRYTGALSVGVIALLLVAERRWQALGVTGVLAAAVVSLQLLYNLTFFGGPFTTGYTVLDVLPDRGLFHPGYLIDAISVMMRRSPAVFIAGILAGIAGLGAGFLAVWRINRWSAITLVAWIIPYLAFYGIYYYSWDGGLLRFLMPIYPAVCVLGSSLLSGEWLVRRRNTV